MVIYTSNYPWMMRKHTTYGGFILLSKIRGIYTWISVCWKTTVPAQNWFFICAALCHVPSFTTNIWCWRSKDLFCFANFCQFAINYAQGSECVAQGVHLHIIAIVVILHLTYTYLSNRGLEGSKIKLIHAVSNTEFDEY